MLLHYTGKKRVTFMELGREVQPDTVFPVPDCDAPAYLSRTDVEAPALEEPAPRAVEQRETSGVAGLAHDLSPSIPAPVSQAPDDIN